MLRAASRRTRCSRTLFSRSGMLSTALGPPWASVMRPRCTEPPRGDADRGRHRSRCSGHAPGPVVQSHRVAICHRRPADAAVRFVISPPPQRTPPTPVTSPTGGVGGARAATLPKLPGGRTSSAETSTNCRPDPLFAFGTPARSSTGWVRLPRPGCSGSSAAARPHRSDHLELISTQVAKPITG